MFVASDDGIYYVVSRHEQGGDGADVYKDVVGGRISVIFGWGVDWLVYGIQA